MNQLIQNTNINTETDIHYGTIYATHVMPEALDDIISNGEDLNYNEALKDFIINMKSVLFEFLKDEGLVGLCENEDSIDVPDELIERFNDKYQNDYAVYEYTDDGYHITYDNNDNSITITKSPYYTLCGYASPCFPNGGYLESPGNIKTYCLGPDFFDDEYNPLPYDVYRVSDDQLIEKAHTTTEEED